jgi:oxepin-CoA hydrolase/3-oxo-5,6-dehydrosuberyl-CoA semialdehyde dehydrogenase
MTTLRLKSYLTGRWQEAQGGFTQLLDPTTEAVLAEASSQGLDLGEAVRHAREVGLPALTELTFAQRGELLAKASKSLHERRDELLDLSTKSGGNTRGDAKFDVDGATGTLMFYAKLAGELGEARFFLDGPGVQLGRSPRYWGQHVLVPRQGVAVHINAFNFPAWGMCEKAALALLAGMPVISKPATSTSLLSQRMTEILVEDEVFPAGAFGCLVGRAGDLLDHLGTQDVVAFTGSSGTARALRTHAAVLERGCRLNVEADSLNAAVLGRDVDDDSDTFDLFVRDVVRDMTQKAGQKCTAIRRVFVPAERMDAAAEALTEALKATRVGDPSQKGVRMGPLATRAQLDDVRAGVERLAGATDAVLGDGGRGELAGVEGETGYFLSPVLRRASDPTTAVVHDHEVFGPVATLLPYSGDPQEAARLVGLGQGGLVAAVYTDDAQVAGAVALGMAPWSGRVNVGGAKVAEHSLGPGAVLPQLLHGGPGRAGGGEELGGLRGVGLYLQRTALQGYKPLLEKMTAGAHAL